MYDRNVSLKQQHDQDISSLCLSLKLCGKKSLKILQKDCPTLVEYLSYLQWWIDLQNRVILLDSSILIQRSLWPKKFVEIVVKVHGMPKSIVSDRNVVFTSLFWQQLFRMEGNELKMSSSYHPQSDRQTEVVNRCLDAYLRCFCNSQQKEWLSYLPWAEYWFKY